MKIFDPLYYIPKYRPHRVGMYRVIDERKVNFFATRPLALRNKVSGKSQQITGTSCLQELYVMVNCLKEGEFEESLCGEEIKKFQDCAERSKQKINQIKQDQREGILRPGVKTLSSEQASALLKKFPA